MATYYYGNFRCVINSMGLCKVDSSYRDNKLESQCFKEFARQNNTKAKNEMQLGHIKHMKEMFELYKGKLAGE
jgi:hypothetical protein